VPARFGHVANVAEILLAERSIRQEWNTVTMLWLTHINHAQRKLTRMVKKELICMRSAADPMRQFSVLRINPV
jgi:hypothetical protein